MLTTALFSLALSLPAASAVYQGFNYGATQSDGSSKDYDAFKDEFTTAQALTGTNGGFTSARLYTMIQGGTTNTYTTALQAAVDTDTSLLLGLWASGGDTDFGYEIDALTSAISAFPDLASSIAGISVGSEDLYRDTPTGIESDAGVGATPATIASYVNLTRTAIAGTSWSAIPIGHVDTWNAWTNTTSSAVIDVVDFLGVDEYPFYQTTTSNSITNAKEIFDAAYDATVAVASGKPIWITESGWPIAGATENLAVASLANAQTYWETVGCPLFGATNTWWYTLQDAYPTTPSVTFGIVGYTLTDTPLYDLSCANVTNSTTTSSSSSSVSGSAKSTGSASTGIYGNSTSASATGSSGASSTGSSSGSSGSSSSSSSSSSNSTGSSGSSTASASTTTYTGAATNLGSSAAGIFGAVAAAVLLL